ncbi:hypothetical protein TrRE_jg1826 [Triparma retinervis]|uniref:Peptidase S74 domain-containing protein n=1 Tax=Triparma retinervis TaxID=2557542 RepID=A0A9W7AXR5_9STRA|nr:hypothetical protein TrRE_jg1826 [Triparma retinervis]
MPLYGLKKAVMLLFLLSLWPACTGEDVQASSGGINKGINQIYLDVVEADTKVHLEAIKNLPIHTYRLSYERGGQGRTRVGPVGPEVAAVIPEAVEIIPKRTLPAKEKGGKPVEIFNVPVVHDQTLFMYGVGATKEMAKIVEAIREEIAEELTKSAEIETEVLRLEELTAKSMDGGAEVRMRSSLAEAKKLKAQLELEVERAKEETEYAAMLKEQELKQLERNEELVLDRLAREDDAARARAEMQMRKKLETAMKVEEARAESEEQQSAAQHERELEIQRMKENMKAETARAEALARAEAERMNEDVKLRMMKAEAEQRRIRNVAAVKEGFEWIGKGINQFLKNPRDVMTVVLYFSLAAMGLYFSREMALFARTIIESMIGKPKLIRETTKKGFFTGWLVWVWEGLTKRKMSGDETHKWCVDKFSDVVLVDELKERVLGLALSARKAKDYDAPHRHVLLYGPPGTGKTMVAKKMAECVGMDYALMSGGDVGPLGADGVTQIHNLFRWAKMSQKGVLLFIDEAEAFLASRGKKNMSESAHNALNALLYNTGGERKDFMLVLATNRAEDLDAAVLDRCDESLYFGLPDEQCRGKLIKQYFNEYVVKAADTVNERERRRWQKMMKKMKLVSEIGGEVSVTKDARGFGWLKAAINLCKGFSGRELAKVMIAVQGVMYGEVGEIDSKVVEKIIKRKVVEHEEKAKMEPSHRPRRGGLDDRKEMNKHVAVTYKEVSFTESSD